ncbi:MAG: hypothetical protein K5768_09140 [Firmicutes bacterium]|nr:hypothetical protein [Bacillota bacterium]
MANIHPNDIGLATYADVGNVERLRTSAKTVVEAINEIYQTGGGGSSIDENQFYVDGENNVIVGKNNAVRGSNNLIIGSNNIIVGNNVNLIGGNKTVYKEPNAYFYITWIDTDGKIYYDNYDYDADQQLPPPFEIGDKVIFSLVLQWTDENWEDWVSVDSGLQLCEISEISESYFKVIGLSMSFDPPDEIHTVLDCPYINNFVALNDNFSYEGNIKALVMGTEASGTNSISLNSGHAKGSYSLAANYSTASGNYAASFGYGKAEALYSFAANSSQAHAERSASFNASYNYSPYSFSCGNYTRIYGRPLKCTSLNNAAKTLTIESGQDTTNIVGKKIIIRCYNKNNSFLFKEATISSINNNVLTLTDVSFSTNTYAETLLPQPYAFVLDTSSNYTLADFVSGYYSIASGKYSFAHGIHVHSAAHGASTFGKYGNNEEMFSLGLANGETLKTPGMAFLVRSNGNVSADGEYSSPCADYSEFFEWADGNPESEDRTGYFVRLSGDKIIKCDDFETPLGIVSATPAIVGDSGEMHWQGKFVTDDFGRVQYHDVVVPAELDEEGNVLIEEHIESQPILNPEWNAETKYIPRKDRPEWATVGVLGKLIVYDDGTLESGDVCRCGEGGIAVKSIENGYPVLKRIADDKVLIWFKG